MSDEQATTVSAPGTDGISGISAWLDRWVRAGLLTHDQAAVIRGYELEQASPTAIPTPTPTAMAMPVRRSMSVIAEVLAYIGASLALAGVILVVSRVWPDLETWARIAITGGAATAFAVIGFVVPERRDPVFARVRAVVWGAASVAAVVWGVVLARDVIGTDYGATVACIAALSSLILSAALWRGQDRPLQQGATLIAMVVAVGTGAGIAWPLGVAGLLVWTLGATYIAVALSRRLPGVVLTEVLGAFALLVGGNIVSNDWTPFGLLLLVATAGALFVAALVPRVLREQTDQLIFGVAGLVIALEAVPGALSYFAFRAGIATGLVAWAVGVVLIGVGVRRWTRLPLLVEMAGGGAVIIGAAVTGAQRPGFATLFGLGTAVVLLIVGMFPGRILLTVFGSLGLLIFVPWTIGWYFPGENRAPVLITVAGLVLLLVAVILARAGGRFRRELQNPHS